MSEVIDGRLVQLADLLAREMGLHFPTERLGDLRRNITSAGKSFGFKDTNACIEWLLSSSLTRQRIDVLAEHLTVGETYFFREKKNLDVFSGNILKQICNRKSTDHCLRIWSAGCATGEEPYSIAISLIESMSDLAEWNITILATDINPYSLEKASRGVYGKWSFRQCSPRIKETYFKETAKGSSEILPSVKKMVTFAYHNLAKDVFPSHWNNTDAMDVIFCRNVLMYFTRDMAKRVLENFHHCLVDDGYLIISPSETLPILHPRFVTAGYPQYTSIYQKSRGTEKTTMPEALKPNGYDVGIIPMPLVWPGTDSPEVEPSALSSAEVMRLPQEEIKLVAVVPEPKREAEVEEDISRLLEDNPEDAAAMVKLAQIRANQGKLDEAVQWCQKGIASDKLNPAYHYLLASILHEQGQIEEAIGCLKRALYLDPDFVLAHFALGSLTLRLGRKRESSRHFTNAQVLLRKYRPEEVLPGSDGITASNLAEVVHSHAKEPA